MSFKEPKNGKNHTFPTVNTMPYTVSMWVFIALCLQATLATPMGGGKCETTADCVAPNVCSKWGWCQWTKIYGEDGPSQGASAPAGNIQFIFLAASIARGAL